MVNTGKPSSGCKLCRARRIKCDEAKPSCMKCIRSKRLCPGYRDPFEGKIRDETQATIRKFKRTRIVIEKAQVLELEAARSGGSDDEDGSRTDIEGWTGGYYHHDRGRSTTPASSACSSSSFDSSIHGDFLASLVTPLEQQAACYLLADYVLVSDSPGGRKGYYKFAYKILTRSCPARCLLSAFKAVSFVALASRPGASYLAIEAESYYAKALREVNKAIQDPDQVERDDTLAAVLLLAFYETLATTRERMDEYISHIKGAAQLVKMRGSRLVDTDEGAEMFSMTRNQVLAIRNLSPAFDREDYSWLLYQKCADAYVSRVAKLTITCSEIRMQVDNALMTGPTGGGGRHSNRHDPRRTQAVLDLLRKAQAVSKKLQTLDQPANAVWRVMTAPSPSSSRSDLMAGGSPGSDGSSDNSTIDMDMDEFMHDWKVADLALGERYEFHNLYACMIYCIAWTSHLFLTTCIFRCMAWLASASSSSSTSSSSSSSTSSWTDERRFGVEYEAAVEVTQSRIADICAALPYACSWNGYNTGYSDFVCGVASAESPSKGVAGMCIYRPAFTAMMSDYATPRQRRYLESRLRFLSEVVGIKQAGVLLRMRDEAAHPSKNIERDKWRT